MWTDAALKDAWEVNHRGLAFTHTDDQISDLQDELLLFDIQKRRNLDLRAALNNTVMNPLEIP